MAVGMNRNRVLIVGGGAAGYFAAIACAECDPAAEVVIFEATAHPLAKVRVSGGGRCNVTHACFAPDELVRRYPRGGRELLGPLHRWGPQETADWFAVHGVELKTEGDGRMFPVTDDSRTIVDCLQRAASVAGVTVRTGCRVRAAKPGYTVELTPGGAVSGDRLLIATGGGRAGAGYEIARQLGHTLEPPVPSLFTFRLNDARIQGLAGVSVAEARVCVPGTGLRAQGALLITHWGLSGPAVLELSAWGARVLHDLDYTFDLEINWVAPRGIEEVAATLMETRARHPRHRVGARAPFGLPQRLWERLTAAAGLPAHLPWTSVSNEAVQGLAAQLARGSYAVTGKSLFKEEFVTCGGVRLAEVDFRTMESRLSPGLHFAGEVLDIDGITGGFNFQAAWTTGWLAGRAMAGGMADH